jgi:hypothetical protein
MAPPAPPEVTTGLPFTKMLQLALIIPSTSRVYAGELQLMPTLEANDVLPPPPPEVTTRLPFIRIVDAVRITPSLPMLKAFDIAAGGGSEFTGQLHPSGEISTTNPPADKTRTRSGPHELHPVLSPLNMRSSDNSSVS